MPPQIYQVLSLKQLDKHLQANRKQLDQQLQATELDTTSIIHCTPTLSKSLNFYIIFTHLQGRQLKVYIFCNRDTLLDRTNSGCGQKLIAHSPLKLRGRKTLFSWNQTTLELILVMGCFRAPTNHLCAAAQSVCWYSCYRHQSSLLYEIPSFSSQIQRTPQLAEHIFKENIKKILECGILKHMECSDKDPSSFDMEK